MDVLGSSCDRNPSDYMDLLVDDNHVLHNDNLLHHGSIECNRRGIFVLSG